MDENEAEDLERVIWIYCSVQSGAFQGDMVSGILYQFSMYKNKF